MDCFLSEGRDIVFRIAIALLLIAKNELLLRDMEGVTKVRHTNNVTELKHI